MQALAVFPSTKRLQLIDAGDQHVVAPKRIEAQRGQYRQTNQAQHSAKLPSALRQTRKNGSASRGRNKSDPRLFRIDHGGKD